MRRGALTGPRVELRGLRADDWEDWRTVRIRSREWLEVWEPLADPGTPDPVADPEAFRGITKGWVHEWWARTKRPRWYAESAETGAVGDLETRAD